MFFFPDFSRFFPDFSRFFPGFSVFSRFFRFFPVFSKEELERTHPETFGHGERRARLAFDGVAPQGAGEVFGVLFLFFFVDNCCVFVFGVLFHFKLLFFFG